MRRWSFANAPRGERGAEDRAGRGARDGAGAREVIGVAVGAVLAVGEHERRAGEERREALHDRVLACGEPAVGEAEHRRLRVERGARGGELLLPDRAEIPVAAAPIDARFAAAERDDLDLPAGVREAAQGAGEGVALVVGVRDDRDRARHQWSAGRSGCASIAAASASRKRSRSASTRAASKYSRASRR